MQLQVIVNNMNEESKHQSESIALKCDGPLLVNGNNRNKKNSNSFDGKESWFVCICCMFANVIVIGCVYIYGIFFPFLLDEFQGGKTKTALIASLAMGFYLFLCPIAAKICLLYGCRITMVIGGLLSSLGFLASSFAPNLYVLYLTYGLVVGFAASLVYISGMQLIPLYFDKKRFCATGILTVGPGAGILIMSPSTQALLDHLDWRKTMKVLAGINLATCLLGCTITRKNTSNFQQHSSPERKRLCDYVRSVDVSLFKDPLFMTLTLSITTTLLGDQLPYFHLAKYSAEIGIPGHRSSWLYFTIGVTSMIFRILTGRFLDTGFPALRLYQISIIVYAIVNCVVPLVNNFEILLVYALSNGCCFGICASSINCVMVKSYQGMGLGWFYGFQSLAGILSPVLAGLISDRSGSYNAVFYTAAAVLILSVIFVQTTYCIKTKQVKTLLDREELIIVERETVI